MLIVNRGQQLYSLRSGSLNKNYYEVGYRIIYQDSSEDTLSSASPLFVNGIYQIAHIDTTNWTYYLRKVKYNSVNGHIDHAKRLRLHAQNEQAICWYPSSSKMQGFMGTSFYVYVFVFLLLMIP